MHNVQSRGGPVFLQGFQVFQIFLSILLAMATLDRWLPVPQTTHSNIKGKKPLRPGPLDDFWTRTLTGAVVAKICSTGVAMAIDGNHADKFP